MFYHCLLSLCYFSNLFQSHWNTNTKYPQFLWLWNFSFGFFESSWSPRTRECILKENTGVFTTSFVLLHTPWKVPSNFSQFPFPFSSLFSQFLLPFSSFLSYSHHACHLRCSSGAVSWRNSLLIIRSGYLLLQWVPKTFCVCHMNFSSCRIACLSVWRTQKSQLDRKFL